jgi:hypothetical protein
LACGPEVHAVRTAPGAGQTQTRVRAWLGEKTTPTGGVHLSAREGGRQTRPGKGKLGRAEKRRKEKLGHWIGRAGGEKKASLGWATRKKREREKEKREWARPN